MKKNVFGRQFSRNSKQRKALFKSLLNSLVLEEKIETTLEKAKAIRGDADKIIDIAKRGDKKLAVRLLQRSLGNAALGKVIENLALRFSNRTSGYTRIVKLEKRFSDNARMAIMEWVVKAENKNQPDLNQEQKSKIKELPAGKKKQGQNKKEEKQKNLKKENIKRKTEK